MKYRLAVVLYPRLINKEDFIKLVLEREFVTNDRKFSSNLGEPWKVILIILIIDIKFLFFLRKKLKSI